jgi:hypothetical protein
VALGDHRRYDHLTPPKSHRRPFLRDFFQVRGGAKYFGDVDHVDDVPLIIAVTPAAAVVYETGNL